MRKIYGKVALLTIKAEPDPNEPGVFVFHIADGLEDYPVTNPVVVRSSEPFVVKCLVEIEFADPRQVHELDGRAAHAATDGEELPL